MDSVLLVLIAKKLSPARNFPTVTATASVLGAGCASATLDGVEKAATEHSARAIVLAMEHVWVLARGACVIRVILERYAIESSVLGVEIVVDTEHVSMAVFVLAKKDILDPVVEF